MQPVILKPDFPLDRRSPGVKRPVELLEMATSLRLEAKHYLRTSGLPVTLTVVTVRVGYNVLQ